MFNSVSGCPLRTVVARSSIVLRLDIRDVNDMRQLVSYLRSTRSTLDSNRLGSNSRSTRHYNESSRATQYSTRKAREILDILYIVSFIILVVKYSIKSLLIAYQ